MKAKLEKLQAIIEEQQENVAEAVESTSYEDVKTALGETQTAEDTKHLEKTSESNQEVVEDRAQETKTEKLWTAKRRDTGSCTASADENAADRR